MKATQTQKRTKPTKHRPEDNQADEVEMLRRVARGERAAFAELHDRFSGVVYSTVYKVLNNVQDTEDVAQEVFAQIWKKAKSYDRKLGKPLTWIATMSRNRAIDRIRSKQRRSRLNGSFEEMSKVEVSTQRDDQRDMIDIRERGELVRSAVLELTPEQREAIELAYFGGLSQSQVAENLGQPLGTVKARIRRGLHRLRETVESRYGSEALRTA